MEELESAIKRLHNNKSASIDLISNEMLKCSKNELRSLLLKLFNASLEHGAYPWNCSLTTPLHKKGDRQNPATTTEPLLLVAASVNSFQVCCLIDYWNSGVKSVRITLTNLDSELGPNAQIIFWHSAPLLKNMSSGKKVESSPVSLTIGKLSILFAEMPWCTNWGTWVYQESSSLAWSSCTTTRKHVSS